MAKIFSLQYWSKCLTLVLGIAVFIFLALPIIVIVISAFSPDAYPQFPPTEVSFRWFEALWQSDEWKESLYNSVVLLLIVTPVTVLIGTSAAWALARLEFAYKDVIQTFILSPLMIPEIVLGIALLYILTDMGIVGSMLSLVIGHTLIALPYTVRTVTVSMVALDKRLENASMILGATKLYTFLHVTLPLIKPGILAGAIFAAITSFGEISISMFLSAPDTVTVPVRIFNYVDQTFDPTVNAISVIFIVLAVLVLTIIEKTIGLTKVL